MTVKNLSAIELKNKIQQNEKLFLLDVREPSEYQYARIEGSVLIPLNQIPQRLEELARDQEIVVICHHGMRSQQAADYLVKSGLKNVSNLTGGIDAWSCACDSSVPRY
ncbi:MAG: rhodanese-like domain-containing protein [Methylococcales bacterium]|nr:rhodanese-like domain-containing protein [Methylococcales bacterium]